MKSKIAGSPPPPPGSEGRESEMSEKTMTSLGWVLGFCILSLCANNLPGVGNRPEPCTAQRSYYHLKHLVGCWIMSPRDHAIPLVKVHCIASCPMFVRPAKHMVTARVSIKLKFHLIPWSQQDNFHCSDVPLQLYMLLVLHDLNYNREHFINLTWSYTPHVYLLC